MRICRFVLFVSLVLLIRCAALEEILQKPTVEFSRMKMDRLSFTGGTFTFEFQVVNPNPIGFTIREIDYDIRLNDRPFIQGTLTDGIQLPAQGASPFDFPVTIEYFDFFESIQDFFRLENIPYTLSGSMVVGPFRIPFKNTGTISRPELPEVAITSIEISKLSLLGASMALNLSWKNHNEFPVKFNSFEYEIHLGDARVLNGWFDTVHTLEKMGTHSLRLPLELRFLDVGESVTHLIRQGSIPYSVTGRIKIDKETENALSIPFEQKGQVSITR